MIEAMIIFVLLKAFFDRHNFIYHFIRLWNSFLQNITCFIVRNKFCLYIIIMNIIILQVERHAVHAVYIVLRCITVLNIESIDNAIRSVRQNTLADAFKT